MIFSSRGNKAIMLTASLSKKTQIEFKKMFEVHDGLYILITHTWK